MQILNIPNKKIALEAIELFALIDVAEIINLLIDLFYMQPIKSSGTKILVT